MAHEAAHICHGSYKYDGAGLAGFVFGDGDVSDDRAGRNASLKEVCRFNELSRFYSKYRDPLFISAPFNLFEDVRIEWRLKADYPSLALEIGVLNRERTERFKPAGSYKNPKERIIAVVERRLLFETAADESLPTLEAFVDYICEAAACRLRGVDATALDSAKLADEVYSIIEAAECVQKSKRPFARGESYSPELKRPECSKADKRTGSKNSGSAAALAANGARGDEDDKGAGVSNKCRIVRQLLIDKSSAGEDVPAADGALVKMVKKLFAGLKPDRARRFNRMKQGGEIDIDAFVAGAGEMKLCGSFDDNLYVETRVTKRDVAVALLIDLSGSVCGEVLNAQKSALLASCEALDLVGDRFAIIGYNAVEQKYDRTKFESRMFIVKDFSDAYGGHVRAAIGGLTGDGGTPSGEALRFAVSRLAAIDAGKRIIIHLTDGMPGLPEVKGAQAVRDAVKAGAANGIKTFCITINHEMCENMDAMYSHGNWVFVDDVKKLPEKMTRLYKRIAS